MTEKESAAFAPEREQGPGWKPCTATAAAVRSWAGVLS